MMKQYQRKSTRAGTFIFLGIMISISGGSLISMAVYNTGLIQLLAGVIIAIHGLTLRKPYLELGQGKLLINNGLVKKAIMLKNITSLNKSNDQLVITYNKGASIRKYQIALFLLKDKDGGKLEKDLRSLVGVE
ncbi:MAG: hypothetical protein ACYCX4_10910 [Bacillota bacterium]